MKHTGMTYGYSMTDCNECIYWGDSIASDTLDDT